MILEAGKMEQSLAFNGAEAPMLDLDIPTLKAENALRRSSPYAQFQYLTVTFNSTANANTDIRHTLQPPTPEDVDFQVVGFEFTSAPATVPVVYRDSGATRRVWGEEYIVLRCNVASAVVRLLLTVRS